MEQTPPHAAQTDAEPDDHTSSLRGTFVTVLLMAGFFVAAWLGMLAIALERR